nr:MAG TPA: hypothetical protein [Caudoviricetes sp.]
MSVLNIFNICNSVVSCILQHTNIVFSTFLFVGFNIDIIKYIFLLLCFQRLWIAHSFAENVYSTRSKCRCYIRLIKHSRICSSLLYNTITCRQYCEVCYI